MFRDAFSGTTYLEFCNRRNAPSALLLQQMMRKTRTAAADTAIFQIANGPAVDEIVRAIGAGGRRRVQPRMADPFQGMQMMERKLRCNALLGIPAL